MRMLCSRVRTRYSNMSFTGLSVIVLLLLMSYVFFLMPQQMAKIAPFFPLSHGVPRVVDPRVITGIIIYLIPYGLRWKVAPKAYGTHTTLYNRCVRWSCLCVFERILDVLANQRPKP